MTGIVELIIYLLLIGLLIYVVQLVLGMLALPAPVKTIILIILAIVLVFWLLQTLGIFVL